jgi:hypothetical protein
MAALTSNKQVENAAIAWVIAYEKAQGRTAKDKRGKGPTDIESPPLMIEVKAFGVSGRGQQLWLEPSQFKVATDPNFRLYVVENVGQGDPKLFTLRVLEGKQLGEMIAKAKEKNYFLLPWSTTIHDKMPVERLP